MAETNGGDWRLNYMTNTIIQMPVDEDARFTVNPARVASTAATDAKMQLVLAEIMAEFAKSRDDLMRLVLEELHAEFCEINGRIGDKGVQSMAGSLVVDVLWSKVEKVFASHGIRVDGGTAAV